MGRIGQTIDGEHRHPDFLRLGIRVDFGKENPVNETPAMPVNRARPPIPLTECPLKVNVARAPGVVETPAVPPLHDLLESRLQPALEVTDGLVCSKRDCARARDGIDSRLSVDKTATQIPLAIFVMA